MRWQKRHFCENAETEWPISICSGREKRSRVRWSFHMNTNSVDSIIWCSFKEYKFFHEKRIFFPDGGKFWWETSLNYTCKVIIGLLVLCWWIHRKYFRIIRRRIRWNTNDEKLVEHWARGFVRLKLCLRHFLWHTAHRERPVQAYVLLIHGPTQGSGQEARARWSSCHSIL